MNNHTLIKWGIPIFLGTILTIAIGWLFFRNQIFIYNHNAFQIIAFRLYRSFTIWTHTPNEFSLWVFTIVLSYMTSSVLLFLSFGSSQLIQYLSYQFRYAIITGIGIAIGIIIGGRINTLTFGKA